MPSTKAVRKSVISDAALRSAVKRGADLLDDLAPKWSTKVKRDWLDMRSSSFCVLGQVHGEYCAGLEAMASTAIKRALKGSALDKIHTYSGSLTDSIKETPLEIDGAYYGFTLPDTPLDDDATSNAQWEVLGNAWFAQIDARTSVKKKKAGRRARS